MLLFTVLEISYMPYDLFGKIIITDDDIFDRVSVIAPRWLYSQRSYVNYVRCYAVADKIRTAKINGTFNNTVSRLTLAPPWHSRLALDMIRPTH